MSEQKKKNALYMRKWTKARSPVAKALAQERTKNKYQFWRAKVLEALGGKCCHCGFSDIRALQIDHIHGGGQADQRARGYNNGYSYTFLVNILSEPDFLQNFQLLCANCNWIKKSENHEWNKGVGSRPRKYLDS